MRGWLVTALFAAALATGVVRSQAAPVSINIASGTVGLEHELLQSAINRFMIANPDVNVRILYVPERTNHRLLLLRNFFEVQSPELDVVQLDIIWTRELAPHLLDLSALVETSFMTDARLIDAMTVDARLISMPWFVNKGVLFYRSDLLAQYGYGQPPGSWDELEAMSRTIQSGERAAGNSGLWGYVWQGAPYEGLTVNALEWWNSTGGGNLLEETGHVSIANAAAADMLDRVLGWIGDISPPEVLRFTENQSLEQFTHGNAVFLRGWQTHHALLRDSPRLAGRYGVTMLPGGSDSEAAVNGMHGGPGLAISAYSPAPEAALRLVEFLTSEQEQLAAALDGARIPARSGLYLHESVVTAMPFMPALQPLMEHGPWRPVHQAGDRWAEVSALTFATVHAVLRGEVGARSALEQLGTGLQALTGLPGGTP